jgi:hypothetical protein
VIISWIVLNNENDEGRTNHAGQANRESCYTFCVEISEYHI